MSEWNLVTDSSCDLKALETPDERIAFSSVPFVIRAGDMEFIDDEHLDIRAMVESLSETREAGRTSCPSPETWLKKFRRAGNIVAVTISSSLSGSYNSACLARNMLLEKEPNRNIAVIDSKSAGPELAMIVRRLQTLVQEGRPFAEIVEKLNRFAEQTNTIFALTSFDNLVKNGRVNRVAGFVAGKLGMCGIGVAHDGHIHVKNKVRGTQRALKAIVDDMKSHAFSHGPVLISHCLNEELAAKLKSMILENWSSARVDIMPTRGLCSFYAEKGGLIVAY